MSPGRNEDTSRAHHQEGPAYRQIYEHFRDAILNGQLRAGDRLPASRRLATEMGVSRNTVLAAFEQLDAEGYLDKRQGSGTYVADTIAAQTYTAIHAPGILPTTPGTPRHL
uniref:GntR family transcriptional regulator n=1 Tax=Rhodococcus qingshengii TaxID=334542 RepID=UPI001C4E0399